MSHCHMQCHSCCLGELCGAPHLYLQVNSIAAVSAYEQQCKVWLCMSSRDSMGMLAACRSWALPQEESLSQKRVRRTMSCRALSPHRSRTRCLRQQGDVHISRGYEAWVFRAGHVCNRRQHSHSRLDITCQSAHPGALRSPQPCATNNESQGTKANTMHVANIRPALKEHSTCRLLVSYHAQHRPHVAG